MREISPSLNLNTVEYLNECPSLRDFVEKIREEKRLGKRPLPSAKLIDHSDVLSAEIRSKLLDRVALYVDENLCGRSDMCQQFANLLAMSLRSLGLTAREVIGVAKYYIAGKEVHSWEHAWVRVGREVIDGNVDILYENPTVPPIIKIQPYWGLIDNIPYDRMLIENKSVVFPQDNDVDNIWWPELNKWIINNLK